MTSTTASTDYDVQMYRDKTKTWNDKPLGYLDRYYKRFISSKQDYMYIRQAPNGLAVVGVRSLPSSTTTTAAAAEAASPDDISTSAPSVELAFDLVGEKVTPGTMIARINNIPIFANMNGKLLEVNERLIDEPRLLLTDPTVQGHIAIIMPKTTVIHGYHAVDEF